MIIGLTGTIASGKGAVVEYLKSKGFKHYSSSDLLKEMLAKQHKPLTREYLSALADELIKEHPGGILSLSLERAKKDGAKDFILEAIHRIKEADFIKSIGGKIIGVDADLKIRYERTIARKEGEKDQVTFEQFVEHSKREDEGERHLTNNIRAVLEQADGIIINNGSLEELHRNVDELLPHLQ